MTNRVLLDANGLRVSRATKDVISAGIGDLKFNSDWSQLGVFATGSKAPSWSIISSTEGYWHDTSAFGRTFATAPLVFFDLDAGGGVYVPVGDASGFTYHQEYGVGTNYWWVVAQVSTTGLTFNARYNKPTSGWTRPSFTIKWSAMYYNL